MAMPKHELVGSLSKKTLMLEGEIKLRKKTKLSVVSRVIY